MPLAPATRLYLLRLLLLGAGYAAVAYLSLFLVPSGGSGAAIVWPPAAIGIAALFLFGFDLWPALFLPLFFVLLGHQATPPIAGSVAVADTLEALVGAYFLRRFDFGPMLNRLQDAMVLIMSAALSSILSASLIALAFHSFTRVPTTELIWVDLWIGHLVSMLAFGSFALRWGYKPHFTRSRRELLEGVLMFAAFGIATFLTFWTPFSTLGSISLLYISIIPLIWAALRAGPRGTTLATLMMGFLAAGGLLWGWGPLAHAADPRAALLSIQLIVGVLTVIFLLFASIVEERKEAIVALRSNIERLQTAVERISIEDQAKSDFIAILAHELRNPLSPLLSGVELLKSGISGPQEVATMMGAHLNTMARLLDDLLDMSRMSQKKFKLERIPVKLRDIIAQSLEMVSPHLSEHNHTLSTHESTEELWLSADQVRLSQVIVNLLTNAIKYTNPGGMLRLETRRDGDWAVVEVTDNGIGIEPSRLTKVFEPFGATDTDRRRAGGLHIGLSLAKRMTELHQGELSVQSQGLGRGSTFTVRLPLMAQAPLLDSKPARGRSRFNKAQFGQSRTLGVLNILIVDDNEAAADSLARLLSHNGHQTRVAYDASRALALCETYTPHVALLDIGLPGMDGYELARRLRERFGDEVMLVALTGYGQQEDKEKAEAAGFDEHLTKPVSIVDVEKVLLELSRA